MGWPSGSAEWNHLSNFGEREGRVPSLYNYFEFGLMVQGEMWFKDISDLNL